VRNPCQRARHIRSYRTALRLGDRGRNDAQLVPDFPLAFDPSGRGLRCSDPQQSVAGIAAGLDVALAVTDPALGAKARERGFAEIVRWWASDKLHQAGARLDFGLNGLVLTLRAHWPRHSSRSCDSKPRTRCLDISLIILRRGLHGRVGLTNHDRWFFIQLYRWFPSILKVLTIIRPETLARYEWTRLPFRQACLFYSDKCSLFGSFAGRFSCALMCMSSFLVAWFLTTIWPHSNGTPRWPASDYAFDGALYVVFGEFGVGHHARK
jgi:hypothetical protein